MNKILLLAVGILLCVASFAAAQGDVNKNKSVTIPLYNGHWNKGNVNETDILLKKFGSTWYASDTTKPFILTAGMLYGDTLLILGAATNSTLPYNMALKVQFGTKYGWKAPEVLDSLVRIGSSLAAVAASETTADSLFKGKPYFYRLRDIYGGADRFRMIIDKDTTQAAVTDLGTNSGDGKIFPFVIVTKPDKR